jgi:hypothetical protein
MVKCVSWEIFWEIYIFEPTNVNGKVCVLGNLASEINAFLGRVISQILCLRFQKFYAFESTSVDGKVCVLGNPPVSTVKCVSWEILLEYPSKHQI